MSAVIPETPPLDTPTIVDTPPSVEPEPEVVPDALAELSKTVDGLVEAVAKLAGAATATVTPDESPVNHRPWTHIGSKSND